MNIATDARQNTLIQTDILLGKRESLGDRYQVTTYKGQISGYNLQGTDIRLQLTRGRYQVTRGVKLHVMTVFSLVMLQCQFRLHTHLSFSDNSTTRSRDSSGELQRFHQNRRIQLTRNDSEQMLLSIGAQLNNINLF